MELTPEEQHQLRKAYYFEGVLEYIACEYDSDGLPDRITDEVQTYLEECFAALVCYPNAAGKFCELFRTTSEKNESK